MNENSSLGPRGFSLEFLEQFPSLFMVLYGSSKSYKDGPSW